MSDLNAIIAAAEQEVFGETSATEIYSLSLILRQGFSAAAVEAHVRELAHDARIKVSEVREPWSWPWCKAAKITVMAGGEPGLKVDDYFQFLKGFGARYSGERIRLHTAQP